MGRNIFSGGGKAAVTFRQYLAAIVIPVLFIITPVHFLIRNLDDQLEHIHRALDGVRVLGSIHEAMMVLQRSRGLFEITLFKGPVFEEELAALHLRFLEIMAEIEPYGHASAPELEQPIKNLREQAIVLFEVGESAGNGEPLARHTDLIRDLLRLNLQVSALSGLILEPEETSYHLVDIMVDHLPGLMEAAGRLRARGSGLLAAGGPGPAGEIILREHLVALHSHLEKLEDKIEAIRAIRPRLGGVLLLIGDNEELRRFVALNERLIGSRPPVPGAIEYFNAGAAAIEGYYEPQARMREMVTELLNERRAGLEQLKLLALLGTLSAVLLLLAFSTAFYLRNLNAFRRIEELAVTDHLTGLYNRRYLGLVADQELQRARREGKSFTLGVLDIDYFKLYNDDFGHQAGDEVLRRVAAALKNSLQRPTDFLFRIGGEEFCYFFSGATAAEAQAMAEKVRKAVEELRINHPGSRSGSVVTISVGAVFLPVVTEAVFDPLMKRADDALYAAKDAGRNRCHFV